ncbi:MAG: site-specific integrase [Clostridia bacterium]|nr:site-specific integrase [Clostridia bacterium]MBR2908349.1 site-specific integrase [Clostridia bacterium]
MARPRKSNRSDGRYEIKRVIGYDAEGRGIKKSFYGRSQSEALRQYEEFCQAKEAQRAERKAILFSVWVNRWLETYKKPDVKPTTFLTTYERPCRNYILPYFDECILQDITQAHIKGFLNTLTSHSQSLIDKVIICLRGIFEAAIDNDLIRKNPARNISCKSQKQKERKRTYDRESVEYLCSSNHKYALYVHILLRMGLRCSEMCGLRWEDINLDTGEMTIRQALTTENGEVYIGPPKSANSVRKLKIPEDLLERLRANHGEGYLAMLNGRHITPNHFGDRHMEAFYNTMKVPKEQRLSPHELRHTCGTLLYEETKDIYFVSRFLGHSDIGITTKTYVHSEMQDEKIHLRITP